MLTRTRTHAPNDDIPAAYSRGARGARMAVIIIVACGGGVCRSRWQSGTPLSATFDLRTRRGRRRHGATRATTTADDHGTTATSTTTTAFNGMTNVKPSRRRGRIVIERPTRRAYGDCGPALVRSDSARAARTGRNIHFQPLAGGRWRTHRNVTNTHYI